MRVWSRLKVSCRMRSQHFWGNNSGPVARKKRRDFDKKKGAGAPRPMGNDTRGFVPPRTSPNGYRNGLPTCKPKKAALYPRADIALACRVEMKDVTSTSFGLVIAYLLPGFAAFFSLCFWSP